MAHSVHHDETIPTREAEDTQLRSRPKEHSRPTGDGLRRVSPGFYVDLSGGQYFYLTGLYHLITQRLLEEELLNPAALVVEVFDELRRVLLDLHCAELLD